MASLPKTSNHLTGIPILIIAFLSFCCPSPSWADSASDALSEQSAKNMGKLESKLFQHNYAKDEPQVRLERLEKLVFGAPKTGSVSERLNALVQAVPNLEGDTSQANQAGKTATTGNAPATGDHKGNRSGNESKRDLASGESSDYPAVTAMERKSLGKDFIGDPLDQRLGRLETKIFGRPSTSTDLSERVDRLKQRIGLDIARVAPPGSDWADDDEEDSMSMPVPAGNDYVAKEGEDGKSFSGRDLRSDMRKAFGGMSGSRSYSGPTGAYGMGGYGSSSSGGSGAYGFGGGGRSGMSGLGSSSSVGLLNGDDQDNIPAAPSRPKKQLADNSALANMDLPSQVAALEKGIFGKTHAGDPLLQRLNRLEGAVFPEQKPATDKPLPDRVKRLMAVVPVSEKQLNKKSKHSDSDLDDSDMAILQGSNGQAQHGLGKIVNSLSSFFGGGAVGGYPMQSGTYITDPQTGMLVDQYSGTMIDPNTGAVMGGTRTSPYPMYGGMYGSGLGNYGGYNSFNNGFSPFGNPYGYGMGSGLRFGFGGGRMGGIWP
ncbi:MAG: hypothetical protein C5B53_01840 [Candidatus Melainabacteria bacterium]|nr:MAG: hypothetical protein C5B53_01840 [Candidatus Melainabacteria bacterium]